MAFKSFGIFTVCLLALLVNLTRASDPDVECRSKYNINNDVLERIGNNPIPDEENLNNYCDCLFKAWNIINADGSINKDPSTWLGIFTSKVSKEQSKDYPLLVCLNNVGTEPKEKYARIIGNCFNDVFNNATPEILKKLRGE